MAFTVGHFNFYYYMAIAPNIPPEAMPAAEERAQAALMPAVGNFKQRWDSEWLPELKKTYDDWARFDLKGASLERLIARHRVVAAPIGAAAGSVAGRVVVGRPRAGIAEVVDVAGGVAQDDLGRHDHRLPQLPFRVVRVSVSA